MIRIIASVVVLLTVLLSGAVHARPKGYFMDPINFSYSSAEINKICETKKAELQKGIDEIAHRPLNEANFANTVLATEFVTTEFQNQTNSVMFLKHVSTNEDIRKTADKWETDIQQLFVELFGREDLFQRFKALEPKMGDLNEKDKKLLKEYLIGFRRNGLDLSPDKRKVFLEKKKQLVALESEFAKNVAEWAEFLEADESELKGLPDDFVKSLTKLPNGKFKITLDYPRYFGIMDNSPNADLRKKLNFKFSNRGGTRNKQLLEQAIALRAELAKMLGYKTHADFVLERRMANNSKEVFDFLNRLVKRLQEKGKENLAELRHLKHQDVGAKGDDRIYSWDYRYYVNQLKKTNYQVDNEQVKKYFPIQKVVAGMFDIYQNLLGVKFVEDKNGPVWHPSVQRFRVEQDGKLRAYFYMDLYPRDGKYSHAAAFTLVSGYNRRDDKYQIPVSAIVANFNAPTKEKPSLLEHSEVETLFHEFGHIMHQVLTEARYATFSGTAVKTDFVEAPSQMLENWVWNQEALKKLSGYYSDLAKPLPDELTNKLIQAKYLSVGLFYLRQLSFGMIDMTYHTQEKVDSTAIYSELTNNIMMIPIQDGTYPQASFGHMMGGYDAGYYGYLWSKVYAQDMFTRFEKEGLMNKKTGMDYRKWILAQGGEKEPGDLIEGFLGRKPNEEAFLKSLGL